MGTTFAPKKTLRRLHDDDDDDDDDDEDYDDDPDDDDDDFRRKDVGATILRERGDTLNRRGSCVEFRRLDGGFEGGEVATLLVLVLDR